MDVADELLDIDHTIDRAYVERRLDDWRTRIDRLYGDIESWLPANWSMASGAGVSIREDLMLRFAVAEQTLPTKTLLRSGVRAGRIEPRGLWIIGANGRLDLISTTHHSIIVDRAESFERPQWIIMPLRDRLRREPLTADSLKARLG